MFMAQASLWYGTGDRQKRRGSRHRPRRSLLNLVRNEGVLVGGEGEAGNIVKIRPPIVFRRKYTDIAIAAVDRALTGL
jgi:4-aminobutyrate aminotransferase-like enzyme